MQQHLGCQLASSTSHWEKNPRDPPMMLASRSEMNFSNSSWSRSSLEAGPARFLRVLTIPSVGVATERRRSGVISSLHNTPQPAQETRTCSPGTVVCARLLPVPEELQCGISRNSVLTAGLTAGCAVHLEGWGGVRVSPHRYTGCTHSDTSTNPLMSHLCQWDFSLQRRGSLVVLRRQSFTVATPTGHTHTHNVLTLMKAKSVSL